MQSVGNPSFCKDQKRKLLRHRHFCNEFAANNGPEGLRDDFIYQPSISSFWYHPSMVCFVLLGFIQVYSVFRVLHIHSISRVKNELNPFPSTALYLSLSMPIVKDAPDWYWMVCLSSLEASSYLWTISADCLSLESSLIPCLFHPAQHSAQTEIRWSHIQFDKISISLSPPGHGLTCSLLKFVDWITSQTLAIRLVICILSYKILRDLILQCTARSAE